MHLSQNCVCPEGPPRRTASRFPVLVTVWLAMLGVIAGCGSTTSTSKTATASSTTATHRYTSKNFRIPLTVRTDGLKTPPTEDSRNLLSWDALVPGGIRQDDGSQYNKVRLLVPAKVYRPNTDVAMKPPKRYTQFLLAQTAQGVNFSDVTKLTVDGRRVTFASFDNMIRSIRFR